MRHRMPARELVELWSVANGRCWLCGKRVPFPRDLFSERKDAATRDHMIPAAKGGVDRHYVVPSNRRNRPHYFESIGFRVKGQQQRRLR